MNDYNLEVDASEPVPDWLAEALEISAGIHLFGQAFSIVEDASDDFNLRCLESADNAYTLARFSKQAQSIGFIAVSFYEYLSGLAKLTKRPLGPLLHCFRIGNPNRVDSDSIGGLARIWRDLGFGLREAQVTLRLSLLPHDSGIQLLLARRRSTGRQAGVLEQCESLLNDIEAEIGPEYVVQHHALEVRLFAEYRMRPENGRHI